MFPDPSRLLTQAGITIPLIGFYDAPGRDGFEPLVEPAPGKWACVFGFYKQWLAGKTLHITKENYGCGGAGTWVCGVKTRSREEYVKFLVDEEGLKASHELMELWLDFQKPYQQEHPHLFIGPLRNEKYDYLQSITFFVNPDQLALLALGAQYNAAPGGVPPVLAPFGSGCMELLPLFEDLNVPQAIVGATDIAMRKYLPPDTLAFTVTKPMFEQLCALDEKSFLYKPFWSDLKKARKAGRQ